MLTVKKINKISDKIYNHLPKDEYNFIEEGDNYDLAIVRSAKLHDVDFPDTLLAIGRAGIGFDNIPVDKCSQQGIAVFNTPGANANAVKELVICGMLLSCRDIVGGVEWVETQRREGAENVGKNMESAKKAFVGREIAGKSLGIIGLGVIGSMVANAALSLGMKVYGYDPYLSVPAALRLSPEIKVVNKQDEIYKNCDFITLHLHQTEETLKMVNEKVLSLLKPGAVLLNYSRGGLIDDDAVLGALNNGNLAHYVTDFPNDKIIANEKVIATPHLGASTPEAEDNCADMAAARLADYVKNGNIHGSVNLPDCDMPRGNGYRIAIINKNITNMVGQISAVLAKKGVNIEHMLNRSRGDWAYTLIDVIDKPDDEIINAIKKIDGIVRVRVI